MADLADAMGVQKGSLYSLTESKQDLLIAVTEKRTRAEMDALVEVLEAAAHEKPAE